jgi:transcription-repair coupling factor (superfamily II helicase)
MSSARTLALIALLFFAAGCRLPRDTAAELRERFGPLPDAAHNLLRVARLRLAGEALGLERIDWRADALEITARRGAAAAPERVVALVARSGGRARLAAQNRLVWQWRSRDPEGRLAEALDLLDSLVIPD